MLLPFNPQSAMQHRWDISPREAIALQKELAGRVRQEPLGPVELVAGTDCAPAPGGRIIAAAVLCDARTLDVVASATDVQPCRFPYVPGLLSFREAPAVIAAVRKLGSPNAMNRVWGGDPNRNLWRLGTPPLPRRPDLLLCDGAGLAHPRRFGLACHVGLLLDLPTIGVAKSRLCGEHRRLGQRRGCRVRLVDRGEVVGAVVRTRDGVKPLYVSVGHRITLDEAVAWVLRLARRYRLAEPNRRAHMMVTAARAAIMAAGSGT